ncbi:TonB-dependent receptor [Cryomorpha ignava]|uniref:TonB-dependent receptor n=1 Tax=Cryomorpha ignava TaxID=101383 RepID=A0A7K3WRR5_9FLAO|nr:TonB-dependent receptor [Cryomorpha ignava]NEN24363.1 TonB-dependent receptor [Cryomorpha ignava]
MKLGIAALFGMLSGFAHAQVDTLLIKQVEIVGHNFQEDLVGIHLEKLKPVDAPLSLGKSLDNWLANRTNLVLRGYGPGSSYGISIRGSSTSQTQILVNGVPFENPGLATSDVSTLPNAIFSGMSLYRGSAASYLGNAAIGGSILMETGESENHEIFTQNFSVGSFGNLSTVSKMQYGTNRFSGTTRVYFNKAKNNFLRPDPIDKNEEIRQTNGAFQTAGIAQDLNFYGKGNAKGHVFLWAGDTRREIPPIKSKRNAETTQRDESYRAQGIFETKFQSLEIKVNTALDHGRLNYYDHSAGLDEDSEYTTFHTQAELRKTIGRFRVFALGIFRDSHVLTENYEGSQRRTSPAVVGGVNTAFWKLRTKMSLVLRQEFLNGEALPVVPVISLEQKIAEPLYVTLSAGKAYRLPGLNDLFWSPGGNPDLKPESGWFQEAGMKYDKKYEHSKISIGISGFHRLIENWIQWAPSGDFWSPRNIKKVRSQGFEGSARIENNIGLLVFEHQASATYAQATNLEAAFEGDQSVDKQLIYMPFWSAIFQESISTKNQLFKIHFIGKYTGERFTTGDNLRSLDPFFTFDIECVSDLKIKNLPLSIFAAARNIFDVEYQLQASHYMPGINFEVGVQLKINLKKTKNEI